MDLMVLGLDFETQDADPFTTRITEVGAVLTKVTFDDCGILADEYQTVESFSTLCYDIDYLPQTPKIIELTSITDEMLRRSGIPREQAIRELLPLIERADLIVCHKTHFDMNVLKSTAKLVGIEIPEKETLCTLSNFPWPERITCKKLSHIAYEHSILVDPVTLHRATDDVKLMLRVLSLYDLRKVLKYARTPWVYLRADIIEPWKDGGRMKDSAQSVGFSWQRVRHFDEQEFPKMWVTRVKEDRVEELKKTVSELAIPFRINKIEGL